MFRYKTKKNIKRLLVSFFAITVCIVTLFGSLTVSADNTTYKVDKFVVGTTEYETSSGVDCTEIYGFPCIEYYSSSTALWQEIRFTTPKTFVAGDRVNCYIDLTFPSTVYNISIYFADYKDLYLYENYSTEISTAIGSHIRTRYSFSYTFTNNFNTWLTVMVQSSVGDIYVGIADLLFDVTTDNSVLYNQIAENNNSNTDREIANDNANTDREIANDNANTDKIIENDKQLQQDEIDSATEKGSQADSIISDITGGVDTSAFENAIYDFVGVFDHTGTEAIIKFPAIKVPAIGGLFEEQILSEEKEVNLTSFWDYLPQGLYLLVTAIFTCALIFYCLYELRSLILYALTLRSD